MRDVFRSGLIVGLLCSLCFSQSNVQPPLASQGQGPANLSTAATPSTPPVYTNALGEARELYRKGDFEGAIGKYQLFLQEHAGSPDAYAGIARVYLKQKKLDLAAVTVAQGLTQSDAPRLHVALGEVLFRQGKIPEAEQEWVKVIQIGVPDARAYLGLARVRDAIAMYKTAEKLIAKAHELDPSDPDVKEAWVGTLSRNERIKYLEATLAGENNWNKEEREGAESYLKYLRERAKLPNRQCRLVSKVTTTSTPLVRLLRDPTHLRAYGLSVSLNGHKSDLLLDSGASGITVKRSIAERAGVTKISETKIGGVGDKGMKDAYIGIVDSMRIGELEFHDCAIDIMEKGSVGDEDGLIGSDVFSDFLVELDFPNEMLKLGELPKRPGEAEKKLGLEGEDEDDSADSLSSPANATADASNKKEVVPPANVSHRQDRYIAPEMKEYTRIFRFGHYLLVPTKIGNVPPKLFLLDTGAFNNTISPAAAREVTKVRSDESIITGLSGSVKKVYTANKTVLEFGGLRQENQDMIAFDDANLSDEAETEISGFLGFAMLRFLDIKIDYRDALVSFSFDPKRWGM